MEVKNKAERIQLFSFRAPHMRTFHLTWMAFFLCFFSWFGIAPLMTVVREELSLTPEQIGNCIIASVFFTMIARLAIGYACDRFGPRISYTCLLIFGSLPVIGIAYSQSYESFLIMRFLIGGIGAGFVITQYHTSMMFERHVVGTANATTAGWGNLGGGVTQILMPLVFSAFLFLGLSESLSWRMAMVCAGVLIFCFGLIYYKYTTDLPEGNFKDLKLGYWQEDASKNEKAQDSQFWLAVKDSRVWALFVIYGACFGIELTINNIAAIYFFDKFELSLTTAGLIAGSFGLMNIFARSMGGVIADLAERKVGIQGRVHWLGLVLFLEGLALIVFSQMNLLPLAIVSLIIFSLFVQMAEGATYAVVPFINSKNIGSVAGIVGAGGNFGAVAAGYLFRSEGLSWSQALLVCGVLVSIASLASVAVRIGDSSYRRKPAAAFPVLSDKSI
ncbi:MAG: MFS transporter [Oligoflexus sp.]